MKKWISMFVVLVMIFSLAACAAQKPAEASPAPAEDTAAEADKAEETGEEDGQNPIMNFVGIYGHDRASILVEAADGTDGAKITVTWASSAAENSEWVMTGKFDADKLTVKYDDCVKTDFVYKEDGTVESETVAYENGEGTFTFSDGEQITLTWDDAEEHIADGTVFEYASLG